jgi:hypothetical protein
MICLRSRVGGLRGWGIGRRGILGRGGWREGSRGSGGGCGLDCLFQRDMEIEDVGLFVLRLMSAERGFDCY